MAKSAKLWAHFSRQLIALVVLILGMIYPFMAGAYDRLAMPVSNLVQGIGIIGLCFPFLGGLGLALPRGYRCFAGGFVFLAAFSSIALAFFAYLMAGMLFGLATLAVAAWATVGLRQKLRGPGGQGTWAVLSIYAIMTPLSILAIQLWIAKPVSDWSRSRTIGNAAEYIRDIEQYKSKNGHYPKTLQAMYKDYPSNTVGVEQFHYLPFGQSYNLSFEQPRFLLDVIGTREWVVYNPTDEHRAYSHTSWLLLLPPEESALRQGWYASAETAHQHWRSFLFD